MVQRANDKELQWMYLDQELEVAVNAIESGFAILQGGNIYRRNEFAFLLLLTTGLERVMKVILHLNSQHTRGTFLSGDEVRRLSHDLVALRDEVILRSYTVEYLRRPVAVEDQEFMRDDFLFGRLLAVLSDFARRDRYIYLDSIANPNLPDAEDRWPSRRWNGLELFIALPTRPLC